MLLIDAPDKLVLPFAEAGAKNTIPAASQIGITPGAASLTDGFPPLTRTPLAAGGVPPSGLDMNGILFELSAVIRWANAGAGYVYDSTFATDANVTGYPKGARVLRSDGLGYWFNTIDANVTDPEGAGAIAAGWLPDYTTGASAITMTNANVTLTALEYGKRVIVLTGALTANLNLIFPAIVGEWTIINKCTGAYTITAKTAAGTGVVIGAASIVAGDGVNIYATIDLSTLGVAYLATAQNWTAGQSQTATPLPATTGTVSPNFTTSNNFSSQVTGDCTFGNSYTGPGAGKVTWFSIRVQQSAGTLRNWSFGSQWHYVGGAASIPAQTQTASAWDEIIGQVVSDGTISFFIRSDVKA